MAEVLFSILQMPYLELCYLGGELVHQFFLSPSSRRADFERFQLDFQACDLDLMHLLTVHERELMCLLQRLEFDLQTRDCICKASFVLLCTVLVVLGHSFHLCPVGLMDLFQGILVFLGQRLDCLVVLLLEKKYRSQHPPSNIIRLKRIVFS